MRRARARNSKLDSDPVSSIKIWVLLRRAIASVTRGHSSSLSLPVRILD